MEKGTGAARGPGDGPSGRPGVPGPPLSGADGRPAPYGGSAASGRRRCYGALRWPGTPARLAAYISRPG
ncbi:hypothetical protein GCM10010358_18570 [Streptomyces minutiscleroticus]|uniref:Uncharacterized protein n=1 Tax=Streptomyces minutiscleroticus TaxID=68238 RepID=A0A918KHZ3_9ACTN|nr:hypothetical protein GCM10010358_18570 [Streptomyces minutiscleroticus]